MNLADEGITRLTFDPGYDGHPSWSPDGRTIAFEAMRGGSLDIYLMPAEGGTPSPLLISAAAEAAPAWSPDGRWLAYSAYQGGQRDLFLFPLTGGGPINLTQSPDQNEDEPVFSPDGGQLAYTVGQGGVRDIMVTPLDLGAGRLAVEAARVVARGSMPAWSPDGAHLAYGVDSHGWPHVQLVSLADGTTQTYPSSLRVGRVAWGNARLPDALMARALTAPPDKLAELYAEEIGPPPDNGARYRLVRIPVDAPGPFLSDRVDGAFTALRSRVIAETGRDYLNLFGDLWRMMGAPSRPGQNPRSWHKTGRAFDINQGLLNRDAIVVFEMVDGETFFHLYFRTERQDGTQGEPLHTPPWVFDRTGGGPMDMIPPGYWMDFTATAAEYGWHPIEALSRWRTYAADREWWHYEKRDGLSWFQAMTEIYPREQVVTVFAAGQ
jgi:TolB protein